MASTAFLQKAYLAYFGRPVDATGALDFAKSSETEVINAFAASAESKALYGSSFNIAQINAIYQALFNRDAEPAGAIYWYTKVSDGTYTPAGAALAILNGAQNADKTAIENKLASSALFTAALDTTSEMSGYSGDAAAASARAFLSSVTTTAATAAAVDAAVAAAVSAKTAVAPVAGQTFTLTSSVDEVNGGAGADVIKGILGTSGTYGVGDNINGGSGSDTLNLITNGSAIAGGLISLDSIETINVRLLSSAGEAVTLDATDWNGVETVTNASSLASTVLTVTGLAVTTDVELIGQTTINAGFNNTTTATAAVNVILANAGSGTTSTGYATLNVDANSTGLITSVAVDLQGTTNAAYLEGGAGVTKYTVTGSGKGYLNTNDTITSFDGSAATGALDVTFSAASDLVAVGGAGNDTFRFGANYNNSDSMDGGAGTDTIALTVGSFNRNLNTTNVENATVTFSQNGGGELNASASTVHTYTLVAGTSNAVSLTQLANDAVLTLNDDSITNLTLDYASGAATTTLNVGSAAGALDIGTLTVSDVAAVAINSVGSGATIGAANFDSDLRTLTVGVSGGEADLSLDAVDLGGATTVTVNSTGSAGVWFGSAISANKLGTITVNAAGSEAADITFGSATFAGTGVSTITLNATDGADILTGALSVGNQSTASSKDVALTVNVNGASSDVTVLAVNATGMGTFTIDLNQSATADIAVGAISLGSVSSGAPMNFTLTDTSVIAGASAGIASFGLSANSGAQISFGAITVGKDSQFSAGAIDASTAASVKISNIAVTLGASADGFIGAISNTGGSVGNITVNLGAYASADFGAVAASAVGSYVIDSTGARGYADFGNISVHAGTGNFGTIQVLGGADSSDVTFGTIGASGVGAISVAGDGNFTVGKITATTVGTITSTQGVSGAFTIDLSGVTNAVEINLGAGANTVISGAGNDVFNLKSGTTANDTIVYSTATQGADLIVGFGAGNAATGGGADVIQINVSAMPLSNATGAAVSTAADVSLLMFTGASATMASGTNVILMTTAFANTAAVMTQLTQVSWVSAQASGSDRVLIVWGNGSESFVSVALVTASGAATTSFGSGSVAITDTTLLSLEGVSPGALVAGNFDFI